MVGALRARIGGDGAIRIDDPRTRAPAARSDEAEPETLRALIDHFGERASGRHVSWKIQRRTMEYVFQSHLDRPLADLAVSDLQLSADAHRAEFAGALAVRCLRPMLKWASAPSRGFASSELAELHAPAVMRRGSRILSEVELGLLLPELRASRHPHAAAMMFMLLTMGRSHQTAMARWREVDLRGGFWMVPDEVDGEPHAVPLTRQAVELLRSLLPGDSQGYPKGDPNPHDLIFAASPGTKLPDWRYQTRVLQEASGTADWTCHDLRRTSAALLREIGVDDYVIADALNHISVHSRQVANRYKGYYVPPVAHALQLLADKLEQIEKGAEEFAGVDQPRWAGVSIGSTAGERR